LQLKQIDLENIGSLANVGGFENRVPAQLTIARYINIAYRIIRILEKPGIQGSLRTENDSGNRGTDNEQHRKKKKDLLGSASGGFSSANSYIQKMLLSSLPRRRCSSVLLARFLLDCHCQFATLLPRTRTFFATNNSIGAKSKRSAGQKLVSRILTNFNKRSKVCPSEMRNMSNLLAQLTFGRTARRLANRPLFPG
jgi:hypothetical protein